VLAGNVTVSSLANAVIGQQLNFFICQDSAGSVSGGVVSQSER
jgi:hypothetical protein